MKEFGKLDFSTSFNPTSGFPLDARCEFASYEAALAAAQEAGEVGTKESKYYYGMILTVHGDTVEKYVIQKGGTLEPLGTGAGGGECDWDKMQNKPFYRTLASEDSYHTIAPKVSFDLLGLTWYQVIYEAPTDEQLVSSELTLTVGGAEVYNGAITADMLQHIGDDATVIGLGSASLAVVRKAGNVEGEIDGVTMTIDVPAVGVYMPAASNAWAEVSIALTWEETKTLDPIYLPMDTIDARIDAYIEKALGGDY